VKEGKTTFAMLLHDLIFYGGMTQCAECTVPWILTNGLILDLTALLEKV
jgi:hypothetical protein